MLQVLPEFLQVEAFGKLSNAIGKVVHDTHHMISIENFYKSCELLNSSVVWIYLLYQTGGDKQNSYGM